MNVNRKIILDTETTGLDVKGGDRVIEIGCVELVDDKITGNTFHVYLNPEREISKEATRVHGITIDRLQDSPKFFEIANDFIAFIDSAFIVAHNASFDVKFLNSELMMARSRKIIKQEVVIDTLKLARQLFPGSPASLDALCKRFRISLEQRAVHGALLDAQLLARVYIELSKGIQANIDFDSSQSADSDARLDVKKRTFTNTADEMLQHKELIKRLKSPIWDEILPDNK